jgi:hypothetical protein
MARTKHSKLGVRGKKRRPRAIISLGQTLARIERKLDDLGRRSSGVQTPSGVAIGTYVQQIHQKVMEEL